MTQVVLFYSAKVTALLKKVSGLQTLVAGMFMELAELRRRHVVAQRFVAAQMSIPQFRQLILSSPQLYAAAASVVEPLPAVGREPVASLQRNPYFSDGQALGAQQAVGAILHALPLSK